MNPQEALKRFQQAEKNKDIVSQYFEYYNSRNWEKIPTVLNIDELGFPPKHFEKELNDIMIASYNAFNQVSKNMDEVLRVAESRGTPLDMASSEGLFEYLKLETEVEDAHMEPKVMIAEGDEVWCFVIHNAVEVFSRKPAQWTGLIRMSVIDGKICGFQVFWNYLDVVIDIGKIVLQSENSEKIEQYLGDLRQLGLIPS